MKIKKRPKALLRASKHRNPLPRLIAVVGPTASGKSSLAVRLARHLGGEVVSADSRQVYRGLDIATGKITKREMRGVPHHLLDLVEPKDTYTVANYQRDAKDAIEEILKRKKVPIIVGGTGWYIDALARGVELPAVGPNPALRARLKEKTAPELFTTLRKIDPRRASLIDRHNPRRLIRAIEIAKALGRVPERKERRTYQPLFIGIRLSKKELTRRIHSRLLKRLRRGMVAEARALRKNGLPYRRFYELGLEYRFLADLLRGKIDKKEFMTSLERENLRYAKRQMTWFRKNPEVNWVKTEHEAKRLASAFIAGETRK